MPTSAAELRADCSRCAGLCCVAPAFARSSDFAIDKPAGTACLHLLDDFRCEIHERLRPAGFAGCTVFDCFGAGQRTLQAYDGRSWREPEVVASQMFAVFDVLRALHELLWHLDEVLRHEEATDLHALARELRVEVERAADGAPDDVVDVDVGALRAAVGALLSEVSRLLRGDARDLSHAELVGRRFRDDELRSCDLRGALLLGADLRGAELHHTDLLGADLRGCDLRGADLRTALFLTQVQVDAALGDAHTLLPERLTRPSHWS
jgi:Pentapeptide repeats (8 copies)